MLIRLLETVLQAAGMGWDGMAWDGMTWDGIEKNCYFALAMHMSCARLYHFLCSSRIDTNAEEWFQPHAAPSVEAR